MAAEDKARMDALSILQHLWDEFSGLRDTESDIDCSDMVNELIYQIHATNHLKLWLEDNYR